MTHIKYKQYHILIHCPGSCPNPFDGSWPEVVGKRLKRSCKRLQRRTKCISQTKCMRAFVKNRIQQRKTRRPFWPFFDTQDSVWGQSTYSSIGLSTVASTMACPSTLPISEETVGVRSDECQDACTRVLTIFVFCSRLLELYNCWSSWRCVFQFYDSTI